MEISPAIMAERMNERSEESDNSLADLESIEPASLQVSEPGPVPRGTIVQDEDDQGQDHAIAEQLQDESPWPNLKNLFSVVGKRKNNISFECLLCKPKKTVLSSYITSHSNLRKHIKVLNVKK